jgi:hypothetical protein
MGREWFLLQPKRFNLSANDTFVNMDNIMGLLPENIALKVDELMENLWDRNGCARSSAVFTEIIHAYQDLGLDTKTHREWQLPDINDLLLEGQLYVARA